VTLLIVLSPPCNRQSFRIRDRVWEAERGPEGWGSLPLFPSNCEFYTIRFAEVFLSEFIVMQMRCSSRYKVRLGREFQLFIDQSKYGAGFLMGIPMIALFSL
jgi:hypothetical protein